MAEPAPTPPQKRSPFQGFLPFLWLSISFICGILMADWVCLPAWAWIAGMLVCLLALILAWVLPKRLVFTHHLRRLTRVDRRLPAFVLLAVFCLGGWRYASTRPMFMAEDAAFYNDRGAVQLVGTVVRPPDYRDAVTNLTVEVESLQLLSEAHQPVSPEDISGRVLIQVHPGSEWDYGMRIRLVGQLQTPPESPEFSFQDYLARKGIHSLMTFPRVDRVEFNHGNPLKTWIYALHTRAYATLQSLFPAPESDLLAGILLGRDQGLSPALSEAFRRTGTTHIIAISGFNIAILAGLFSGVFTRLLGRKWGALAAVGAISGYAVFVGGDAAVTRAAIMGTIGVLGGMFGRRQNGLNSLGLAAFGMLLINPNLPWDIGFQLSAAATLGLVLYAQPLEERFIQLAARKMPEESAQKLVGPLSEFFLFTLAAQVMTLPIIAYHFGGVSWIALVANPLILPPQGLMMVLGGLSLLVGLVMPGLGQVLAIISLPFVRYTIRMVTWLSGLPVSELEIPGFNVLWLAVFYGLLVLTTLLPLEKRQATLKKICSPQAGLLVLAGLVVFIWNRGLTAPDGHLHLTLLDGEGTVLVQTPSGQALLIGGGASPSALTNALGEMLPAKDQRLDMVVIGSKSREDLLGLIGAVEKVPVKAVLWGVDPEANQASRTLYALLAEKGIPLNSLISEVSLDAGDELRIDVLWADEQGAVLWLTWDNFSALIPTGAVGDHWLNPPTPPAVLVLPDGLGVDALPMEQVSLWAPRVILLPLEAAAQLLVGEHPLIDRLAGYPLVTTRSHGWARVSTDGQGVWVRTER